VDQQVNFFGGESAYIDDYFCWRVGKSAEDEFSPDGRLVGLPKVLTGLRSLADPHIYAEDSVDFTFQDCAHQIIGD
jgi:hypothetical protein